ncbi:hypothetical protein K435DRAFT_778255, partial [Dendrothele bispora CBS 962.96]
LENQLLYLSKPVWIHSSLDCALGFSLSFSPFPFRFLFLELGPTLVSEADVTKKRPQTSGVKSVALRMKSSAKGG